MAALSIRAGTIVRYGPLPIINSINALWFLGPDDVWAVGQRHTVAHWDGHAWTSRFAEGGPNGSDPFEAVWASGPTDVWVIGSVAEPGRLEGDNYVGSPYPRNQVSHWDGARWATIALPVFLEASVLSGIHGSGPDDVWITTVAAGEHTRLVRHAPLFHWNGKQLTAQVIENEIDLVSVWASSPTDAWITSRSWRDVESVWHWDGAQWTREPAPSRGLAAVWGGSAGEAWVADRHGEVQRWDPARRAWELVAARVDEYAGVSRSPTPYLRTHSHGFARWTGDRWEPVVPPQDVNGGSVGGMGSDMWLIGFTKDYPTAVHYDGNVWTSFVDTTELPPETEVWIPPRTPSPP